MIFRPFITNWNHNRLETARGRDHSAKHVTGKVSRTMDVDQTGIEEAGKNSSLKDEARKWGERTMHLDGFGK